MGDDEIAYVIGHELGHHLLGSIRFARAASWVSGNYYEVMHERKALQHLYFVLGGNQAFDSMRVDPELFDLRVKRGGELTTAVLQWQPFSEFSCDRVGAIAVGDAEIAVRAMFKLVIGTGQELQSRFGAADDVEAFLAQHDESLQLATEQTKMMDAVRSHPFLAVRMRALRAFGLALPAYLG
jgi:Zn-dependent protease with chaperone function